MNKKKANVSASMSKKRHPLSKDFGERPPKLVREDVTVNYSPGKNKSIPLLKPVSEVGITGESTEEYSEDSDNNDIKKGKSKTKVKKAKKNEENEKESEEEPPKLKKGTPSRQVISEFLKDAKRKASDTSTISNSFQAAFLQHVSSSGYDIPIEERVKLRRMNKNTNSNNSQTKDNVTTAKLDHLCTDGKPGILSPEQAVGKNSEQPDVHSKEIQDKKPLIDHTAETMSSATEKTPAYSLCKETDLKSLGCPMKTGFNVTNYAEPETVAVMEPSSQGIHCANVAFHERGKNIIDKHTRPKKVGSPPPIQRQHPSQECHNATVGPMLMESGSALPSVTDIDALKNFKNNLIQRSLQSVKPENINLNKNSLNKSLTKHDEKSFSHIPLDLSSKEKSKSQAFTASVPTESCDNLRSTIREQLDTVLNERITTSVEHNNNMNVDENRNVGKVRTGNINLPLTQQQKTVVLGNQQCDNISRSTKDSSQYQTVGQQMGLQSRSSLTPASNIIQNVINCQQQLIGLGQGLYSTVSSQSLIQPVKSSQGIYAVSTVNNVSTGTAPELKVTPSGSTNMTPKLQVHPGSGMVSLPQCQVVSDKDSVGQIRTQNTAVTGNKTATHQESNRTRVHTAPKVPQGVSNLSNLLTVVGSSGQVLCGPALVQYAQNKGMVSSSVSDNVKNACQVKQELSKNEQGVAGSQIKGVQAQPLLILQGPALHTNPVQGTTLNLPTTLLTQHPQALGSSQVLQITLPVTTSTSSALPQQPPLLAPIKLEPSFTVAPGQVKPQVVVTSSISPPTGLKVATSDIPVLAAPPGQLVEPTSQVLSEVKEEPVTNSSQSSTRMSSPVERILGSHMVLQDAFLGPNSSSMMTSASTSVAGTPVLTGMMDQMSSGTESVDRLTPQSIPLDQIKAESIKVEDSSIPVKQELECSPNPYVQGDGFGFDPLNIAIDHAYPSTDSSLFSPSSTDSKVTPVRRKRNSHSTSTVGSDTGKTKVSCFYDSVQVSYKKALYADMSVRVSLCHHLK